MRTRFLLYLLGLCSSVLQAQEYRGEIRREDGRVVVFNFTQQREPGGGLVWLIRNAGETIRVDQVTEKGDSLWVQMPLFESAFRLRKEKYGMSGLWVRGVGDAESTIPFRAVPSTQRFPPAKPTHKNATGRWQIAFVRNDGTMRPAVGEFVQEGNHLQGTILTRTGDYRYLEGVVSGDSLMLSTFDGSHAYLLTAHISNRDSLVNGWYHSGAALTEQWTAVRNPEAALPDDPNLTDQQFGSIRLSFQFPDLDSNLVSINDPRFRNKVVIVEIMGSWCPNCMDETAFLSEYYRNNKQRGVEVVALAYEASTNFARSQKSLRKFQQKFHVQYPMLITGVTSGDSLNAAKTLPQLGSINVFPTTLYIGRDGLLKKIHTGFFGPGSGAHYETFKREFEATIDHLLGED